MKATEYTAAVETTTRSLNMGGLPRNLDTVEKYAAEQFNAELGGTALEIAIDALNNVQ